MPPKGLSPAMSKTQYGPGETWPRHQMPYWNVTLAEARAAAWTLHYLDAPHCFGTVFCPGGDDGMRHSFKVDKTARGGESMSREARKLIRRCQHGSSTTGSRVRARQEECRRLLDEAEQLISIADDGLTMAEARAAAWADLERLETQLETAAANVAETLRTAQEAGGRRPVTLTTPLSQMRSRRPWATPQQPWATPNRRRLHSGDAGHTLPSRSSIACRMRLLGSPSCETASRLSREQPNLANYECWNFPTVGYAARSAKGGRSDDREDPHASPGD